MKVLDASVIRDRLEWEAWWQKSPSRDVFAHPGYARLFAGKGKRVICLVDSAAAVLFPVIVSALHEEPWTRIDERRFDLSSPYGYGGPIQYDKADPAAIHNYWRAVDEWASQELIVTGYAGLSPFKNDLLSIMWNHQHVSDSVICRVDREFEAVWRGFNRKIRKNVRRAERSGVSAGIENSSEAWKEFIRVYYDTLNRRGATGFYYFSEDFFERLRDELRDMCTLFIARNEQGRVLSVELLLTSATRLYSFLGGSTEEGLELRANELLKATILEWACKGSWGWYVLGGGKTRDDGVFKYKQAFAPDSVIPYTVAKRVFDQTSYIELCRLRRDWMRHENLKPCSRRFPAYRMPVAPRN